MNGTLWDHAPVRSTDPVTSHIAAHGFDLRKLRELQWLVYRAFMLHPEGLTDDELQDALVSMGHGHRFRGASTASTRREELLEGDCKACHGTGELRQDWGTELCGRCWGTGQKPGLIAPLLDAHGIAVKRPTRARHPAIVWGVR